MKDNLDHATIDVFSDSRLRGRPLSSSPRKRRADSVLRSARYRSKQKIIKNIAWLLTNIPSINASIYQEYLRYLNAGGHDATCHVKFFPYEGKGVETEKDMLFSELTEMYNDYEMVFILHIIIA